ncbi:hypothetical protein AB1A64_14500 [Ruegeria sp. ANG10]|uniref:hypothetical protein n=1 Tax=Ruegeria sp. ANG10 TaxID=3042467 RepID=UPI00345217E3
MGSGEPEDKEPRFEWEDEIESTIADVQGGDLTFFLEKIIHADEVLHDGHAFSKRDVNQLRTLAELATPTDEDLINALDLFVVRIGWKRMRLIKKRASDRVSDLKRGLLTPLRKACEALDDRDVQLEFVQDEMAFRPQHRDELKEAIDAFLETAAEQIELIKATSKSGKAYDNDLKYYHVHLTDALLEAMGCPILPSRLADDANSWFLSVVRLLAGPIFGRELDRDGFTSLVREFVDNQNSNIRTEIDKFRQKQCGKVSK